MSDVTGLLQQLIRVDTTNPPGNETAAAEVLRGYLEAAGVECELYARVPERANLVARIRGQLRLRGIMTELEKKNRDASVVLELTQALASNLDFRGILFTVVQRIAAVRS